MLAVTDPARVGSIVNSRKARIENFNTVARKINYLVHVRRGRLVCMKTTVLIFSALIVTVFLVGCGKHIGRVAAGWSVPLRIAESIDGLGGRIDPYKFGNAIVGFEPMREGTAKCFIWNSRNASWFEVPLTHLPGKHDWVYPLVQDQAGAIYFPEAYTEDDRLTVNMFGIRMAGNDQFEVAGQRKWTKEKEEFFGTTDPNVHLNEVGKRGGAFCPCGVISGQEWCFPFFAGGKTYSGSRAISHGPYCSGVFHSRDGGVTWQVEKLSNSDTYDLSLCKTEGYYYCLMNQRLDHELVFSRQPVGAETWDALKVITKTLANTYGRHISVAEKDAIHVCWMDRRHEKHRFNLVYPNRQNWEIAYSHRRDADAEWSKDVVLSKGLLYSYFPSMSVEGKNVVVAWSGIRRASDWHSFNDANDIYYVTSSDGGETWTEPIRVTDGAKDGITSGEAHAVLLDGVIHLLYTQGRMNLKEEMPGLTLLNQPPWPIYYQHRVFPR